MVVSSLGRVEEWAREVAMFGVDGSELEIGSTVSGVERTVWQAIVSIRQFLGDRFELHSVAHGSNGRIPTHSSRTEQYVIYDIPSPANDGNVQTHRSCKGVHRERVSM